MNTNIDINVVHEYEYRAEFLNFMNITTVMSTRESVDMHTCTLLPPYRPLRLF